MTIERREEWNVRPLVEGWSMWRWGIVGLTVGGLEGILSIALGLVIAITRSWVSNPVVSSLLICFGLALASMIFGYRMVLRRRDEELAAGYTTSRGSYLQYEQVDEATGLVVRRSGEPALSRREHRDRVARFLAERSGVGGADAGA
ncbi:hypothetical protein RCH16_000366 [Cryobacterium sp. MP_M5]|uniref:hypothetical protein n=1 Tax=unclassified Cryobacterium TaxID=2649013 RepID=UPI0018CB4898|nr:MULTISPECIES: hypothetical protein [unclassified Cryobacterium]MBG6057180.1 hypothetical protein [Cryobacterium sp. MP_M3]MEC5175379.1 hypothetical protein [Cryobacterium sp. MP_M5]